MARREKQPTGPEALTSIGEPIHCAATPDQTEEREELDEIEINNFINTLAEVAMAVATRRLNRKGSSS